MKIEKLRILNYKGFRDSGDIEFGPGFNVIVGQNNAGKSALLEAFRLRACEPRPYRGLKTDPIAFDPLSKFEVQAVVSGRQLLEAQIRSNSSRFIPIPPNTNSQAFVDQLFSNPSFPINFTASFNHLSNSPTYPAHKQFVEAGTRLCTQITLSSDRQRIIAVGTVSAGSDDFLQIVDVSLPFNIYVFKPERMNIGSCAITHDKVLAPDGQNLPSVLMLMQANRKRFDRFNEHIRTIIPNIYEVVVQQNQQNQATIKLWTVNPASEREDLTIELLESGTGVSQVLAILYVAMNRTDNVIVIDEPNSFLHPGAAKKLIEILKLYPSNQYVFSTHSPELIAVADPDTLHLVQWNGEESVVKPYDKASLTDLQRIFNDVGVTLSDVFGADKIVWVEGPTERECFPKLAALLAKRPIGVSFVALRNTGDLESTKSDANAVIEIYENLSAGTSLVPPTLSFNLDREARSPVQQEDIIRRTKGRVKFLPRLTYENYLIDADALAAIFNDEAARHQIEKRATSELVTAWLKEHGGEYAQGMAWDNNPDDEAWLKECHAPNLLKAFFDSYDDARLVFKKTTHSVALTKWLIEHKPDSLKELVDYVDSLIT